MTNSRYGTKSEAPDDRPDKRERAIERNALEGKYNEATLPQHTDFPAGLVKARTESRPTEHLQTNTMMLERVALFCREIAPSRLFADDRNLIARPNLDLQTRSRTACDPCARRR